jgi:hypothetical protein
MEGAVAMVSFVELVTWYLSFPRKTFPLGSSSVWVMGPGIWVGVIY